MIWQGPRPSIEIPDVTLYELIFGSLTDDELDKVAIDHTETDEVFTFGRLRHEVDAAATWLHRRGIRPGDVVAIVLANCPEYAVSFHGILRAGAVATPVNPAAPAPEMASQLQRTGARLVITSHDLAQTAAVAAASAGLQPHDVVVVGQTSEAGQAHWADVVGTEPQPPQIALDPATALACMPTSSGTSGLPKAVMLTHRNLVANALQFTDALHHLGPDSSLVAFLPFSHIYALTTTLTMGLLRRFPLYTMSSFRAHLFLDIVESRRPTVLFVVPPVATFLARSRVIDTVDWSSVELVISGAAPLDGPVGEALEKRLDTRVVQGYGMTELSPVTHITPVDRPDIGMDTIGQALANVTFRVVDPQTLQDVPAPAGEDWSQTGELWVKGPNAMVGYLDQSDATDEVIVDGWVRTGDLVQVRHDGTTRIVDRIKELIKRRGFQVPPAELESHLLSHPDVDDAAVLGLGEASGDQIPHALLVLRDGVDPEQTATDVVRWLNGQVAQYKHLGGATVVESLPRSAAGKILRRQLPDLVVGG